MLAKVSENQTFNNSKSKIKNENVSHVTEAVSSDRNYDDMFSKTQGTIGENKTFVTLKEDKSSIDNTKDLITLGNAGADSNTASFSAENIASLLHEKKNLDKNETLVLHLNRKLLKMSINNTSLEDTLKLYNVPTCSRQNISIGQLKTSFYPIVQKMTSSNALKKEIILNTHIASRRQLETLDMDKEKTQEWSHKLNYVLENEFFTQSSTSALDFVNGNSSENQKLNLLCVFTNESGKEEISSNLNKLSHDEDIRMVLPMTWNVVAADNDLIISDENNQHIAMYFRNPLKTKFDYRYSNLPFNKKFRFKSAMDDPSNLKERFQNGRKKKIKSPFTKTTINQFIESLNWPKSKAIRESPKIIREKKTRNVSFLLLREPILFNCIEHNKPKQVLMYKTHSVESVAKDESKNSFSKILEDLHAKSIQYDGEPVYLISEPLKLMSRLKKQEEIRSLKAESNRKCKHNFIGSTIYKKLLTYKQMEKLRNTQYEKQSFRNVLPKNEYTTHINTINEISGGSVITTRSCLNLPRNFSSSFIIKDFDANNSTFQETCTSRMSIKPFVTRDNCSGLAKNFCGSVTGRNFDLDELFGGHKSKFRRSLNITALKHVNVKKLVSSIFRDFFHFYSLLGGNLRSGAVITRSSSTYWLKVAGVATDSCTLKLAGEIFTTIAGKKIVLNIFDYIKFLVVFARTRRLLIVELVKQMMVCEDLPEPDFSKGKCKRCMTMKNQENGTTELFYEANNLQASQSLPNIWPTKIDSNIGNRSSLNEDIF